MASTAAVAPGPATIESWSPGIAGLITALGLNAFRRATTGFRRRG